MKHMSWQRLQLILYPLLWGVVRVQIAWAEEPANDKPLKKFLDRPTRLLQIFDSGQQTIDAEPGIQPFFTYFNMIWPWILGIAAGIGVLQGLIGGIQIMLSGSDSGRREEGKNKLMWATAGLVMIGLSGLILESLNSTFYVQV